MIWELDVWELGVPLVGRPETDTFIQAAHPISLEVDRDVLIPDGAELLHDALPGLGLERPGNFARRQLNSREGLVVPHAADAKAEVAEHGFGSFDHAQLVSGHL